MLGDADPAERLILVNASEAMSGDTPTRRHRFTIAHELGHWICHATEPSPAPTYCRSQDVSQDTDRTLEREANVFGAELLMPEAAVREAWAAFPGQCARRELLFRVPPIFRPPRRNSDGSHLAAPVHLRSRLKAVLTATEDLEGPGHVGS